jgi:hypothetical protein
MHLLTDTCVRILYISMGLRECRLNQSMFGVVCFLHFNESKNVLYCFTDKILSKLRLILHVIITISFTLGVEEIPILELRLRY